MRFCRERNPKIQKTIVLRGNPQTKSVQDAWDKLTDPKNLLALESLFYQLPEGPQMEMARKALQVCRDRSARTPAENDSKRTEREKL